VRTVEESSAALAVERSMTRVSRAWKAESLPRSWVRMRSISARWLVRAVTMRRAFLVSGTKTASGRSEGLLVERML